MWAGCRPNLCETHVLRIAPDATDTFLILIPDGGREGGVRLPIRLPLVGGIHLTQYLTHPLC